MNGDSYDLLDALDALHEKCLDGYRISIFYDPRDQTSWLTWAPPEAPANAEAGRGHKGSIFDRDIFVKAVRQFVLDADRIRSLKQFQARHEPPPLEEGGD